MKRDSEFQSKRKKSLHEKVSPLETENVCEDISFLMSCCRRAQLTMGSVNPEEVVLGCIRVS